MVQEKADEALRKQNEILAQGRNIAIEKEKIEKTMMDALKPLKAAKSTISEFNKDAIVDLLEMDMPPEDVQVVGECFLIIKSIRDISWKSVRNVMVDEAFVQSLVNINCDLITLKQVNQCKSHLKVSNRFDSIDNVTKVNLNDIFIGRKPISLNWKKHLVNLWSSLNF